MSHSPHQSKITLHVLGNRLEAYVDGAYQPIYQGRRAAIFFSRLNVAGAVGTAISDSISRGRPLSGQELNHIVARQRRLTSTPQGENT
jgi:hypothetical protein